MSLRIAHIGAGYFSSRFVFPQLAEHDVELAAVCDLVESKALAAQRRYGFGKGYTDFGEMLEKEKPDAVFCIGGPRVHYEVGMEVLDRGFPLYVQKPPASSPKQVREMADLARRHNVVCHVGFNLRYSTAASRAKAILKDPSFGVNRHGIFRYGLCSGATLEHAVLDQHCHLVDLAAFLMGPVEGVTVIRSAIPDARDYVCALKFRSGAVGTLNFTQGQIIDKEFIYFEVTGDGSFLYSHGCAQLVWKRSGKGKWWKTPEPDQVYDRGWYGERLGLQTMGYLADVDNFLGAVKGEVEDVCPVSDTVSTMETVEEMIRQIREKSDG